MDGHKVMIVYGRTVNSLYDRQEARKIAVRGHDNVIIPKGGLSAWKREEYPVQP